MSYAIVWNTNNGDDHAGTLDLAVHEIQLVGTGNDRGRAPEVVRYDDLDSLFVERTAPARNSWEPALVLVTHGGDRIAIGSLAGTEALYELADVVAHGLRRVAA
jgi:hypothetical protein